MVSSHQESEDSLQVPVLPLAVGGLGAGLVAAVVMLPTPAAAGLLAIIVCGVLYVTNIYVTNRRKFASILQMPSRPHPLIMGHVALVPADPRKVEAHYTSLPGNPHAPEYGQYWIGPIPGVETYSPNAIKAIIGASQMANIAKPFSYDLLADWLGPEGILLSDGGPRWQHYRHLLSPVFQHQEALRGPFYEVMREQVGVMADRLHALHRGNEQARQSGQPATAFDVFDWFSSCMLDIICEAAMGFQLNSQHSEAHIAYTRAVDFMKEMSIVRFRQPWLMSPLIFGLSPLGRRYQRELKIIHDFTNKVIQQRRELLAKSQIDMSSIGVAGEDAAAAAAAAQLDTFSGKPKQRPAFLDVLLFEQGKLRQQLAEAPTKEARQKIEALLLDDKSLREEVDTLMFAGHDTISSFAGWALYLASRHPRQLEPVVAELDAFWSEKRRQHGGDEAYPPTGPDELRRLHRLDCFIKEVMRVYPSVPGIARTTTQEVDIDGHIIPAGVNCHVEILALHRNPAVWPDPMRFEPLRFDVHHDRAGQPLPPGEKDKPISPYEFMPFSAGPRNCLGRRYAELGQRVMMARLLHEFQFFGAASQRGPDNTGSEKPVEGSEALALLEVALGSVDPVWLQAKPRASVPPTEA